MNLAPALELRGVTKDFVSGLRGVRVRAVDALTLTIKRGGIFGLLGPNGSGKSTTIKIILGFIRATAGTSTIFGVPTDRPDARRAVGYLPESPDFYRYLTGRELVSFHAELCGIKGAPLNSRIADVIEQVGLTGASDRRVGTYSKGMLQRIGLAQAIVHEPKLLILDEPTAGVDLIAAAAITQLLVRLKEQGTTIVITSHVLAEIEDLCDRVAILDHGRLVAQGAVADLTGQRAQAALRIASLPASERAALDRWLVSRGHPASSDAHSRRRLEEVFLAHTEGAKPA
jgi:ABC-2 type transport system ATP-binding protein